MRNPILALTLALPLLAVLSTARPDDAVETGETAEAGSFDHTHAALTRILAAHVEGDRVDYAALKEGRAALDEYTASLEVLGPEEFQAWTREERYAFWINAYNAYTLEVVTDHYPLASIREIKQDSNEVWDIDFIQLAQLAPDIAKASLSLNDIEHQILRKQFEDARVHAAVNCASQGCPPLAGAAFDAEHLDEMLTEQARAWVADESRNRIDRGKNCIELSRIFEWFGEDFVRDAGGVREWVQEYAPEESAAWLASVDEVKIRFLEYSWDLNDVE